MSYLGYTLSLFLENRGLFRFHQQPLNETEPLREAWEKLKDARDDALAKMIISSCRTAQTTTTKRVSREKKHGKKHTHTSLEKNPMDPSVS